MATATTDELLKTPKSTVPPPPLMSTTTPKPTAGAPPPLMTAQMNQGATPGGASPNITGGPPAPPPPAPGTPPAPAPGAPGVPSPPGPAPETLTETPAPGASPTLMSPPDPSLVRDQMQSLLDENSQYIQSSEAKAIQYANSRGLQNSSIAAQAGRQAALDAALPIASQDAASATQSKLQQEQFGYNTALSEQQHLQQLSEIAASGDVSKMLQDNDYQNQLGVMTEQLKNTMTLSDQEQTEMLQQMEQANKYALEQIAANADSQVGAQLQAQYLVGVTQIMSNTSQEVSNIYNTQGLTPDQQANAVRDAYARQQANIDSLASFYASSPDWDPNWESPPGTPPPAPGTPPGPHVPSPSDPGVPPGPGLFPPGFPNNQFNP